MSITKCPVPVLQDEWEFTQLLKIYNDRKPENVLEIGSFYGGTLWHWLQNDNLKKIYGIDLEIYPKDPRFEHLCECRKLWGGWLNIDKLTFIKGNSHDDYIAKRNYVNIDWLYIDGGHRYLDVKQDFDNFSPLVPEGGAIILHDIIGIRGVNKFWKRIKNNYNYIEIYSPGGWGVGVIFK
jgi:cephalosporin hydroxylase